MDKISTEFTEIQNRKKEMSPLCYFSRASLKLREWDVLSSACHLLEQSGEVSPVYASEQESPDFEIYGADELPSGYVEITEALRPDYRRGIFWPDDAKPDAPKYYDVEPPLDEPWKPLRKCICAKAKKDYPKGTWLIVYFDISSTSFRESCIPFGDRLLPEHIRKPFKRLQKFERVLILSCDMSCLVELHPSPRLILDQKT
jgi:hypothetical protein